jgi:hypothetical protein
LKLIGWVITLLIFFLCTATHTTAQSLPVETAAAVSANNADETGAQQSACHCLEPTSIAQEKQQRLVLLKAPINRVAETPPSVVPLMPMWKKVSVFPATPAQKTLNGKGGFHWGGAIKQSLLFLGVQHGFAMTQEKTRRELRGPFLKDYFRSVSKLGGWADGGRFFTNYISHPMEGAVAGFIQIQNDPHGIRQEFGKSRAYWKSRAKSMLWNAAYSTQFELGPISQSSLGNVGLYTSLDGKQRKMSYVDLVVTPTLGTAWLIGEDFLDRYIVRRWEGNRGGFRRNALRMILNPMRGSANLLRFKLPWHRDR